MSVYPYILSGGSGTRLWPISRSGYPKQLQSFLGEKTLFQQAASLASAVTGVPPAILANEEHRFSVAEQLSEIGLSADILLEPFGRNTAPAAIIAALHAQQRPAGGDTIVLLMPSDHMIHDVEAFREAVSQAAEAAAQGSIVTFGVKPSSPETAYGYIRPTSESGGVSSIERFVEKPDAATAETYLASGQYLWNAGIFIFKSSTLIDEAERLLPQTLHACRAALKAGRMDLDFLRLDPEAFEGCENISLDYGLMEKTSCAAVLPVTFPWSDLGSWNAIWKEGARDTAGNVGRGDVMFHECKNTLLYSSKRLVAGVGLKDLIVVECDDAVLVLDKKSAEKVRLVVDQLKQKNRQQATAHNRVHRPWGWFEALDAGPRHQVKVLTIKPAAQLSLQSHFHRSEHWVLVKGTVRVTRDDESVVLTENQSIYIPLGAKHRLENPGKIPAQIIEVQTGSYLGEDDIVRFEDTYGRLADDVKKS